MAGLMESIRQSGLSPERGGRTKTFAERAILRWAMTLFCVGLFVGVPAFVLLHPGIASGWVGGETRITESTTLFQIENPWGEPEYTLARNDLTSDVVKGQLLFAHGGAWPIGKRTVLKANGVSCSPLKLETMWADVGGFFDAENSLLSRYRGAVLCVGIVLLLLGYLFVRILSALFGGALGMIFGWWAISLVFMYAGYDLPVGGAIAAHLLGFLFGIWLGVTRRGWPSYLFQRASIGLLVYLLAEGIAHQFGWSADVVSIIGLLGSLLSPALGVGLTASFLMAGGIGLVGLSALPIIAATGVSVHLMTGGSWFPIKSSWLKDNRRGGARGEVPLERLVS